MLDQLLAGHKDQLVSGLMKQLGVGQAQAGGFFDAAVRMLSGLLGSGQLDTKALLAGDFQQILSKLDLASLAGVLGKDTNTAGQGVQSLLTQAGSLLKDQPGGLEAVLGQVAGTADSQGGLAGALRGIGKIFGR
jgi:hypothetical protein